MTEYEVGDRDYRKATDAGGKAQMSLTGFVEGGKLYRVEKTEDGCVLTEAE